MRIVVTGAAGLVGSALVRRTGATGLTRRDLDITDERAVREAVARLRPDLLINCAVTGVDECEADPDLARAINVEGPRILARAVPAILHFSSNYVLDPVNVYGRTKLEGEEAVAEANERALIVRTSWVFGRGKESFLGTAAARLARGERIRAITDTWASTTYVEDLVTRVLDLLGSTGLHDVVNDGVLTYDDFAREAARLAGADPALIERVTESEMGRLAPRPRYTPMRADPPMRRWQEALADYVSEPSPPRQRGRRWS
ncbi:MAG TPA: NAD(P)-dependent oxidoreductase [Thermoanaerobaculia bacterium]|nr:NAD(P)-dependent oxidoreductase [Thermoanaerobaculia bacterium]